MPVEILLPWWGWGYLTLVLTMFIAGSFFDQEQGKHMFRGEIFSVCAIYLLVFSFFNVGLYEMIKWAIIPMTAMGVYWEFMRSIAETERAKDILGEEHDLDDDERKLLLNMAIIFNAFVVVPGYMIGIVLSFRVLQGLGGV